MALLVSCLDEGLLLVEGDRIERIDGVPSAGLAVGRFGGARAVHDPAETTRVGEILLERGRRLSVAGLLDAHELAWDGQLLVCVSTLGNAVLWVDASGRVVRRWQAPGEGDCWHLSGVAVERDRTLVSSFGRFPRHRDWAEADREAAGLVLEVPSGRVAARGLASPHSPRVIEGLLVVCDSGRGDLVVGTRRIHLGGWTRGLTLTRREVVVGLSARRGTRGLAHLAVLRRSDLTLVRRIPLPVREVFDIAEIEPDRARALADRRPKPPRTSPLRPADLRVAVSALRTLRLRPGHLGDVGCSVANLGSAVLSSAPPHPVAVVADWSPEGRALWSPLPRAVGPGEAAAVRARVLAPVRPGRYELELKVVQAGVAWLDGVARADATVA